MTFQTALKKSRKRDIHLLRCKDLKGRECYYILQCPKEKIALILRSTTDISNIGHIATIIAKGVGHVPDEATWAKLFNDYGLTADDFRPT